MLESNLFVMGTAWEFIENIVSLAAQQFTAANFAAIGSSTSVFNKWDANEYLRELVEVDREGGR